jgi:branched-chain amino acid transport system substrate-binding protein
MAHSWTARKGGKVPMALVTLATAVSLVALSIIGGAQANAAPSGPPIKVVTISAVDWNGPTYEDIQIVAKTYEKWINAKGGINGRPLQVITCDDKGDPTQTEACARKAISEGAIADVGSFTYNQAVMVPIYNEAKTAVFGNCCNLAPIEYTSPNTFQMGNNPILNPAGVAKAIQDGCKAIGVLELDLPGITEGVNQIMDNMAKAYSYKGKPIKYVKVPLTTQDYTSQVTQVTDGTDCISMFLSGSNISGMLPVFAQTGGKQRLYGAQGNFDKISTKGYENLPGVKNGVVYGAYPPLQDPAWVNLRAALKTYKAPTKFDYNSLSALGTWAAYTAFTQIVSKMTTPVTPANFIKAASKSTVNTKGMTPIINFSRTWPAFNGTYARAFNRSAVYFKWSDYSTIGPRFVDLTKPAQGIKP